jgi:hypothetical protein
VLGRRAIVDLPTVLLALGTLAMLTYARKVPEPLVILGAGIVGFSSRRPEADELMMANIPERLRGPGYGLVAAALFGVSAPLSKLLLQDVRPIVLAGCSTSAAASRCPDGRWQGGRSASLAGTRRRFSGATFH